MVRKLDLLEFALVLRRGSDGGDNELKMSRALDPFRFVLIAMAGWMKQRQQQSLTTFAKRTAFFESSSVNGDCGSTTTSAGKR